MKALLLPWIVAAALGCGQASRAMDIEPTPADELAALAKGLLGPKGADQLFYFPTRDEPASPATWGFKFEDVHFDSGDGTRLHGWFIPAKGVKSGATVVFSHGNAGSLGHHLGFVMWLVEAGHHVMMYDYRGFGKSGGRVDRRGMVEDARAAIEYTANRADVDPGRLVSYGHSMGGAKSIAAFGEKPVRGLRAVIVDGAFASYQVMARNFGGRLAETLITDELAPRDYVGKLSPVPLLVVHGSNDEVVPVSQGRELYEKARQPKTMFEVARGRHGDALARDNGAFRKRMLVWLAEQVPDAAPPRAIPVKIPR